jgi:flagellar motor switch protein FliM
MHICFPAATLEPIVQAMASGNQRARELNTQADQWLQKNLSRVPLGVSAQLETTLPARDLVLLTPGQILELPHVAGRDVDVHVGGRTRFQGRLTIQTNGMAAVVVEQVAYQTDAASMRAEAA